MFTTMTLRPPLPEFSESLSMLHSHEIWILLQDSAVQAQQVAFVANKGAKPKHNSQTFTSENRGFIPAAASSSFTTEFANKLSVASASKPVSQVIRTEEVLKGTKAVSICLSRDRRFCSYSNCLLFSLLIVLLKLNQRTLRML